MCDVKSVMCDVRCVMGNVRCVMGNVRCENVRCGVPSIPVRSLVTSSRDYMRSQVSSLKTKTDAPLVSGSQCQDVSELLLCCFSLGGCD